MKIDLRMYIRTWLAATMVHPYDQVNANKHDSDMPYVQDARILAFIEQTEHLLTEIGR